eukprot:5114890-Heterocapsa_arctica.AAC.1
MKSSFSWTAHESPEEFHAVILAVSPVQVFSCLCAAPLCPGILASPMRIPFFWSWFTSHCGRALGPSHALP